MEENKLDYEEDHYVPIILPSGTSYVEYWNMSMLTSSASSYRIPYIDDPAFQEETNKIKIVICLRCGTRFIFNERKITGVLTEFVCTKCGGELKLE